MMRRPTLEGAMRHVVAAEPLIDLRSGMVVSGLVAESAPGTVPRVVGVTTRTGESIGGRRVVVATGREPTIGRWLAAIGAVAPQERSDPAGLLWYTRFLTVDGEPREAREIAHALRFQGRIGAVETQVYGADTARSASSSVCPCGGGRFACSGTRWRTRQHPRFLAKSSRGSLEPARSAASR